MSKIDHQLLELAEAAGLMPVWRDVHRAEQYVGADTLREVLNALDIPCASDDQCRDSLRRLQSEADSGDTPPLVVVRSGAPIVLRLAGSPHYRLQLEDGTHILGTATDVGGGRVAISGIRRPGYHALQMGRVSTVVAIIPSRAPSVADLTGQPRPWVLGTQIYSLRRAHRTSRADETAPAGGGQSGELGGIVIPGWEVGGDFSAVATLARKAAAQGAAGMAISPVHAMFTADAQRLSPYSPSSRLFLNAMYGDPATVLGAEYVRPLMHLKGRDDWMAADGCMDWPAIQAHRLSQLRRLYDRFIEDRPDGLMDDFEAFCRKGGSSLASHACYEALHAHHSAALGVSHGWQDWPAELQDPNSDRVHRFSQAHEAEVRFHMFLQWLAARSLADAHGSAHAAGMPLGLIADMAVGTDPRGSHAWARQDQIMTGVSVGAPPDAFQPRGQDWGLTAFSSRALRLQGYGGFIETLRAVLAHAGGVRVDHILGLARMWLVPKGAEPSQGVYLRYPQKELMDLLSLEAWRHQAVVVGENLGTVPEDFNDELEQRGILGMNVLWFEQESEPLAFHSSAQWPAQTMAMVTTHDLPTLKGWWCGRDIAWRERLGHTEPEDAAEERSLRTQQKAALWKTIQDEGLADGGVDVPEDPPAEEVLAFVAGTPAALCSVSLEDLVGQQEQPNLPGAPAVGSDNEAHPNWRRTMEQTVDEMLQADFATQLLARVRQARDQGEAGVESKQ